MIFLSAVVFLGVLAFLWPDATRAWISKVWSFTKAATAWTVVFVLIGTGVFWTGLWLNKVFETKQVVAVLPAPSDTTRRDDPPLPGFVPVKAPMIAQPDWMVQMNRDPRKFNSAGIDASWLYCKEILNDANMMFKRPADECMQYYGMYRGVE